MVYQAYLLDHGPSCRPLSSASNLPLFFKHRPLLHSNFCLILCFRISLDPARQESLGLLALDLRNLLSWQERQTPEVNPPPPTHRRHLRSMWLQVATGTGLSASHVPRFPGVWNHQRPWALAGWWGPSLLVTSHPWLVAVLHPKTTSMLVPRIAYGTTKDFPFTRASWPWHFSDYRRSSPPLNKESRDILCPDPQRLTSLQRGA